MEVKKTWFSYLSLFLFVFGILYIIICGISTAGEAQEYPYFVKCKLMIVLALSLILSHFAAVLGARFKIDEISTRKPKLWLVAEVVAVVCILLIAFIIRVKFVRTVPMTPESDYKTYYEIAQMLNSGTLLIDGKGYCDYVAIFPHVLGYSAVLAVVFKIFGTSIAVGQMFNIVLAVATCFIIWLIVRMLAGRLSSMFALCAVAFWPSMILYNNFLAAEYLFSFIIYLCALLMIFIVKHYRADTSEHGVGVILHIVLGTLLACGSAIRPMSVLLLISILICLIPSRMPVMVRPKNDIPISSRILEKGWLRAIIILLSYLIVSSFITKCVAFTVDRDLAGGTASMGYNLLVGLNEQSYGGWNEDDSAYLYEVLESTGSPEQAQIACRDLAFERLRRSPSSILNLFMHKYSVLWSNDDYGITWNIIFLEQHGELTPELMSKLYKIQDYNNIWYLSIVFLAGIAGIYLIKGRGNWCYIFVLLFCGTVAIHLLVENQNRYHFHCLYAFAILAAVGLHEMYLDSKYRVVIADADRLEKKYRKAKEKEALERIREAEEYAERSRMNSLSGYFDMKEALESGHIKMSVSESCTEDDESQAEVKAVEGSGQEREEATIGEH